jgi:hypothetical protein
MKPFTVTLRADRQEVAMISEAGDGTFTVEPMRFLYPYQAKREAKAQRPKACDHVCNRKGR